MGAVTNREQDSCETPRGWGAFVLGCLLATTAQAQVDLSLGSLSYNVLGATPAEYLVDSSTIGATLRIVAQVQDPDQRQPFNARLDLVGLDAGLCADQASLPAECVHPLQTIGFAVEDIEAISRPTGAAKDVRLPLSEPGVDDFDRFVAAQWLAGRTLHFRIALDIKDVMQDPDLSNNQGLSLAVDAVKPLSGKFFYGPIETRLLSISPLELACGSNGYWVWAAETEWNPGDEALWQTEAITLQPANCVEPVLNSAGVLDLRLDTGGGFIGDVAGSFGGLDVVVSSIQLNAAGATLGTIDVALPANVSFHPRSLFTQQPEPKGSGLMSMSGAVMPASHNLADLVLTQDLAATGGIGFLQPGAVPFAFEVEALTLDTRGLTADYSRVHYAYDMPFAAGDPRGISGARSNDARMRLPDGTGKRQLLVDGTGLAASAGFGPGRGRTHYPRTELAFGDFSLRLAASRLVDGQVLKAPDRYRFVQSPQCPGCPDSGGVPARVFAVMPGLEQGVAPDGGVVTYIEKAGENAAWGPDDGSARIFERTADRDQPAVLFLPGFEAAGSVAAPVAEYLLGARRAHIEAGALLPAEHYLLRTPHSRAGNFFRAGLNLGPEILVDAAGLPAAGIMTSLSGLPTRIGFGGVLEPDFHAVPGDAGTKLVIREGGVTGVFGSQVVPQPTVYGYKLQLSRFAFRQVANALDELSWMDGLVDIPAPADFRVDFRALELACSGDVGGGRLNLEGEERLLAWKTQYNIQRAAFEPPPGTAVCEAAGRTLVAAGIADIKAFDRSLTIEAGWLPDGMPSNPKVEGGTNRKFDRPDVAYSSPENLAMPLAIEPEIELRLDPSEQVGWFELRGLIEPHFWDPLPVDVRVQNRLLTAAEQTLVFRQGELDSVDDQALVDNADANLIASMESWRNTHSRALYDWVGTIDFDLPIFYDAGRRDQNLAPRFLGEAVDMDLSVFDARVAADFVTPDATKVSFGASANFNRLAQEARALHVNLNDPASVAAIDSFLNQYLLIPEAHPIQTLVEGLNGVQPVVDCFNDLGFESCLEQTLRDTVRTALGDPDAVAAQLQSTRGTALSGMMAANNAVINAITQLNGFAMAPIDGQLLQMYNNLPAAIKAQQAVCVVAGPICDATLPALQAAQATLVGAVAGGGALAAALVGPQAAITGAQQTVDNVQTQLSSQIPPLLTELSQVRSELQSSGLEFCSQANSMIAKVRDYRDTLQDVNDKIDNIDKIWLIAEAMGFDGDTVKHARDSWLRLTGSIDGVVVSALNASEPLVNCEDTENVDLGDVLTDADAYLGSIETSLTGLLDAYAEFRSRMLEDADGNDIADDKEVPPVTFPGLLGRVQQQLADMQAVHTAMFAPGGGLLPQLLCGFDQSVPPGFESGQSGCLSAAPGTTNVSAFPLYAAQPPAGIQNIWDSIILNATNNNYQWAYPANAFLVQMINQTIADLNAIGTEINAVSVNGVWPALGFIPSVADGWDLVEFLVDFVMNRDSVEDFIARANELLGDSSEQIIELVSSALFHVSHMLRLMLDSLGSLREDFFELDELTVVSFSPVSRIDEIDGYALIKGPQMERIALTARLDFLKEIRDDLFESRVMVDIERWSSKGIESSSCQGANSDQMLDVLIHIDTALGDTANVFGKPVAIDTLFGRVSLQQGEAVGYAGGLGVISEVGYGQFGMNDMQLVAGGSRFQRYCQANPGVACDHDHVCQQLDATDHCEVVPLKKKGECRFDSDQKCELDGDCYVQCAVDTDCPSYDSKKEHGTCSDEGICSPLNYCAGRPKLSEGYFGGRVASSLAGFGMETALMAGKLCGPGPLEYLDPQAAEYITLPDGLFNGIYVRGGVNFPIIPGGCAFNISAGVDAGSWVLGGPPVTVGGLLSGSATGRVACIAGLRGEVTTAAEFSGSDFKFIGEAFGVAGFGFDCDPGTWTSIPRSRGDKWCATADGKATVKLENGRWSRGSLNSSGLH